MRGFPPSTVLEDVTAYDLAKVVGDMGAVIQHFGANLQAGKALVGGHDFGAAVAQLLALFKPDLVSGLILFNPPLLPNLQKLVQFDEGQQKLSEYTIPFINFNKGDERPKNLTTSFIPEPARRKEIEEYLNSNPIYGMLAYYKRNYPGPPYGQKIEAQPIQFQLPTLVIWGSQDEYFSPKMVDGMPEIFGAGVRLVTFPKSGHWPFRQEPEKVNREVLSWLAELGNAGK